jgi:hypothetical protein
MSISKFVNDWLENFGHGSVPASDLVPFARERFMTASTKELASLLSRRSGHEISPQQWPRLVVRKTLRPGKADLYRLEFVPVGEPLNVIEERKLSEKDAIADAIYRGLSEIADAIKKTEG